MGIIKTYKKGKFSQINLDDGSKILLSYGATDMRVFSLGFMSLPKETLHIFSSNFTYKLTEKIGYDMSKDIVKILADKLANARGLREVKETCRALEASKNFIKNV